MELNASDTRSKKSIESLLTDLCTCETIQKFGEGKAQKNQDLALRIRHMTKVVKREKYLR